MLNLLGQRPLRVMPQRPGSRVSYGLDFRAPIKLVAGFNLVRTPDQLLLELLDERGAVVASALLPRPELEDLT